MEQPNEPWLAKTVAGMEMMQIHKRGANNNKKKAKNTFLIIKWAANREMMQNTTEPKKTDKKKKRHKAVVTMEALQTCRGRCYDVFYSVFFKCDFCLSIFDTSFY